MSNKPPSGTGDYSTDTTEVVQQQLQGSLESAILDNNAKNGWNSNRSLRHSTHPDHDNPRKSSLTRNRTAGDERNPGRYSIYESVGFDSNGGISKDTEAVDSLSGGVMRESREVAPDGTVTISAFKKELRDREFTLAGEPLVFEAGSGEAEANIAHLHREITEQAPEAERAAA